MSNPLAYVLPLAFFWGLGFVLSYVLHPTPVKKGKK